MTGTGSGGGGGYNIPVSLSAAETTSIPQTINAPFNINYAPGSRVGGDTEVSPTTYTPATATSSAALGGDSSSVTGEQGGLQFGLGNIPKSVWIVGAIVVGVAVIGGIVYFVTRK